MGDTAQKPPRPRTARMRTLLLILSAAALFFTLLALLLLGLYAGRSEPDRAIASTESLHRITHSVAGHLRQALASKPLLGSEPEEQGRYRVLWRESELILASGAPPELAGVLEEWLHTRGDSLRWKGTQSWIQRELVAAGARWLVAGQIRVDHPEARFEGYATRRDRILELAPALLADRMYRDHKQYMLGNASRLRPLALLLRDRRTREEVTLLRDTGGEALTDSTFAPVLGEFDIVAATPGTINRAIRKATWGYTLLGLVAFVVLVVLAARPRPGRGQ